MSTTRTQSTKNSAATNRHEKWVSWKNYSPSDGERVSKRSAPINAPIQINRTKPDIDDREFKGKASKAKQEYWSRLKKVNIGRWNGKWSHAGYERNIFKKNLCEILAGHLELKDHQASRITPLFLSLDLRDFRKYDRNVPRSEGGKRDKWPLIVFCICILVCWEDGRIFYPDPNTGEDKRDKVFAHIAERLGLEDDVIVSCVGKLRHHLRDRLGEPKDPPMDPIKYLNWSMKSSSE
ncbi:hypothetical protein [Halorussus marinus]|uniref:hypothetical protein n=1 Tax=Halorussus marinus TaxID=2505976 RepID=UPI00106E5774|nr:hypothetical protein [Halorussus marinus]